MEEEAMDALKVMEEANRIIEDFPTGKYVIYFTLFAIETALAFWLALSNSPVGK
jgi:hypothetical protein